MPLSRLRPLVQATVLSGLLLSLAPAAGAAGAPSLAQLQALQSALNPGGQGLAGLLAVGPGLDPTLVELRRRALLKQFPDASWTLTPGPNLRDGRSTVELQLQGTHAIGGSTFRLVASQRLALTSSGGRITGQDVIREQTILRSGDQDLAISLLIPDAVQIGRAHV